MKKILFAFLGFIFITLSVMGLTDIPVEKIYLFTQDNVSETIQEFISDEKLQIEAAKKYDSLVDSDGKISAVDFVDVCIAGGIKARKSEGYKQCLDFFHALLDNSEIEIDGGFNMNCPASGNGLKSITDETQVGDFCHSSNIAFGEVILKKEKKKYICTCQAYACNPEYKFEGGACKEDVKDEDGDCYRTEIDFTPKNIKTNVELLRFRPMAPKVGRDACQSYADKKNCKLRRFMWKSKDNKYTAICNPPKAEYDAFKAELEARNMACPVMPFPETNENNTADKCTSYCKSKTREKGCRYKNNLYADKKCICNPDESAYAEVATYKEVCGDDKGKTGKKEYCVEGVFNWINVGELQAIGLAKLYAKKKHGNTITCSAKYRTSYNDDYLKCATSNGIYYEFQFDDIKESVDLRIDRDVEAAIGIIYGRSSACGGLCGVCTQEIKDAAKSLGFETSDGQTSKNKTDICRLYRRIATSELDSRLKKSEIDGVDPKVFYHGIQINAGQGLLGQLRDYVSSQGYRVSEFDCVNGFSSIPSGSTIGGLDDILFCDFTGSGHGKNYNKKEIYFIFDDASEAWLYVREKGESSIQCIAVGGSWAGEECHGLTYEQCIDANTRFKELHPDASGMKWEGSKKDGKCILLDAREAEKYDLYVEAGTMLLSALDCLLLTHTGCALLAVESAAWGAEKITKEEMRNRVGPFVDESYKCKARTCAKAAIKTLGGRVLSVQGGLDEAEMHAVDKAFATLVSYLQPEDLKSEVSNEADWEEIVRKLGGDPEDASGKALVVVNKIAIFAQFASIGVSGLRLTGKAVAKIGAKAGSSTAVTVGTKMSKFADKAEGVAEVVNKTDDVAKIAGKTDNVADAAKTTDKVEDATTVVAKTDDAKFTSKTEIFGNTADQTVDMEKIKKYREEGFDDKLKMFKKNNSRTISIQKGKLTDAEWNELNKSLASENVQLVDNGDGYMRFVSTGNTDDAVSVSKAVDNTKSASNSELAKKFNMGTSQNADDAASVSKAVDNTNTKSLSEIEYAYEEKLHNDVLTLQQEAGMKEKVEKYNEMLERAKKELSPEDYKAFEEMKNVEIGTMVENPGQKAFYWEGEYRMKKDLNLMEENLKKNTETRVSVDAYTADQRDGIATREEYLKYFRQKNPKAAKFFDDNIETMHDAEDVIISSDKKLLAKKANMNKEMAKIVDNETLAKPVKEFKQNIIANFPESMYKKAKNWSNMTIDQRKSFISNEIQPYLQRMQGCDGVKCEVQFKSVSEIGGNASYSPGKLNVSDDYALHLDFDNVFAEIVHENVHLGQGEFKNMSEELVSLSNKNALDLTIDFQSYRLNPTERQAYVVNNREGVDKGIFLNFLHDVAEYHGWK
jgi:hypothetical protein